MKDLASHLTEGAKDDIEQLQGLLQKQLDDAAKSFEQMFVDSLFTEANSHKLSAGKAPGGFFVGPFHLSLDFAQETGVLAYANHPVCPPILLDATKLIAAASAAAEFLLAAPTDIAKLANDFEEAIRVALTRSRRLNEARELRCPLPELHREMTLLRQDRSRTLTTDTFRDYPLARFIVELKSLVQSEQNVKAPRRFRLEPAVIENTKNSKKSVFIPTDLQRGFGEGTYFQALVLVNES